MSKRIQHWGLRSIRRARPRRGATLLVTVLLGVVAASITLVIVRTALDDARVTAARRAYDLAYGSARDAASTVARSLQSNPDSLLESVSSDEPTRICSAVLNNGVALQVPAGDVWPSACGTRWSYETADPGTRVWVQMPGPGSPDLLLRAVAEVAGTKAGVEYRFRPGTFHPSLLSESTLDLSELNDGPLSAQIKGLVYSSSSIQIPETGIDFQGAVLASETSITGTATAGATLYAGEGVSESVAPIRELITATSPAGSLRARAVEIVNIACPGGVHVNTTSGSNHLCLTAGGSYTDAQSQPITAPSSVAAWLVLPERTSTSTIDVYTTSTSSNLVEECPTAGCSLAAVAASTPGHLSRLESWTFLGTFNSPASGLVSTDATTHLGLCGSGFSDLNGSCTAYRGSSDGVNLANDVTIVVGTVQNPADLFIAGPVVTETADLGLVVTGDVIIPYWSRVIGADFSVEADLLVLGQSSDAPIRSLPADSPGSSNIAGRFDFLGTLAASRVRLDLPIFEELRLVTTIRSVNAPWWSVTSGWSLTNVRRLTAAELANPSEF